MASAELRERRTIGQRIPNPAHMAILIRSFPTLRSWSSRRESRPPPLGHELRIPKRSAAAPGQAPKTGAPGFLWILLGVMSAIELVPRLSQSGIFGPENLRWPAFALGAFWQPVLSGAVPPADPGRMKSGSNGQLLPITGHRRRTFAFSLRARRKFLRPQPVHRRTQQPGIGTFPCHKCQRPCRAILARRTQLSRLWT